MGLGDLNTIRVTGTYVVLPDGVPASGKVIFTPTAVLQDPAADLIILPATIEVILDAFGSFEVLLPASDDPDITPIFTYQVQEVVAGGRTYSIEVPYNSPGGTLDLADVAPVQSGASDPEYVLISDYNTYVGTLANGYTILTWTGSWPQRPNVPAVIWSGGTTAAPPLDARDGDIWVLS